MEKYLQTSLILITAVAVISVFIYPSLNTAWNVYYERQTAETFFNENSPKYDNLSYLGRTATFVPAHFLALSGFLNLAGLRPGVFGAVLLELIANAAFVFAVFYFGKQLKFSDKAIFIIFLILLTQSFVLPWVVAHCLHMFGFALFIFVLGYCLSKKSNEFFAGVVLGVSGLVHSLYLVVFPFTFFAFSRDVKKIVKTTLIAAVVFLVFYSPILLRAGLPYEIQATTWGYAIRYSSVEAFFSLSLLFTPFILLAFYKSVQEKRYLRYTKFIILFLFILFFISYRINIFLGILFAVLAAAIFQKDFKNKKFYYFVVFVGLLNIFLLMLSYYGTTAYGEVGVLNEWVERPLAFIKYAPDEKVISEPFFGHSITYYTGKKVLADLYVEYANDPQYLDSMKFVYGNVSVMDKYNISTALMKQYMNTGNLTVLYSNGYFLVAQKFGSE